MARMGIDNLKANLTNPARTYLWEVLIPNVIGGGSDTETLLLRCQSTSIPGRTVEGITVPFKATAGVKFPGRVTFTHTWDCEFIEGEDKAVFQAFYNWLQKIVNAREGVGEAAPDVKVDIVLNLLNTKGEQYNSLKLVGCYPEAVGNVDLNYNASEVVRFTVTFSYDWVEQAG